MSGAPARRLVLSFLVAMAVALAGVASVFTPRAHAEEPTATLQVTAEWKKFYGNVVNAMLIDLYTVDDTGKLTIVEGSAKRATSLDPVVTWTGLPLKDANGKKLVYTASPQRSGDPLLQYSSTKPTPLIKDGKEVPFATAMTITVTNNRPAYANKSVHVSVKKIWKGFPEGTKHEATFVLERAVKGKKAEVMPGYTLKLTGEISGGGWAGLPRADADGNRYSYFVREINVPENCEVTTRIGVDSRRGHRDFEFTNTYKGTGYESVDGDSDEPVDDAGDKPYAPAEEAADTPVRAQRASAVLPKTSDLSAFITIGLLATAGISNVAFGTFLRKKEES